jgi:hypothetical protein
MKIEAKAKGELSVGVFSTPKRAHLVMDYGDYETRIELSEVSFFNDVEPVWNKTKLTAGGRGMKGRNVE